MNIKTLKIKTKSGHIKVNPVNIEKCYIGEYTKQSWDDQFYMNLCIKQNGLPEFTIRAEKYNENNHKNINYIRKSLCHT